jgi:membrane protease YdiL (CAAX protease family)
MDFDFKSNIEEEKIFGFQNNILILIISLLGMFVLPSIVAIAISLFLPSNIDVTYWSYIAQLLAYALYVIILFMVIGKDKVKNILKQFTSLRNLKTGIIFAVIAYIASLATSIVITTLFGSSGSNANQESLDASFITNPGLVILLACVGAPIVEELVFRYSIYRPLAQKNKVLAYIVTIIGFAGIHFISTLSVFSLEMIDPSISNEIAVNHLLEDLKTLPIYMVGAFVLTFVYDINGNIGASIFTHAFYNLSQVLLMFLALGLTEDSESMTFISQSITNLIEYIKLII